MEINLIDIFEHSITFKVPILIRGQHRTLRPTGRSSRGINNMLYLRHLIKYPPLPTGQLGSFSNPTWYKPSRYILMEIQYMLDGNIRRVLRCFHCR